MADPYVDATTGVLRNKLGIADANELAHVEGQVAAAAELALYRRPTAVARHDFEQLRAVHRHLFADVYQWAGEVRTVDIVKDNTMFALARHIEAEGRRIFAGLEERRFLRGLSRPEFVQAAGRLLGDLNALHPFREGNGRAQRAFLQLLARDAGWQLAWAGVTRERNTAFSAAAMGQPDALSPMLDEIVVPLGEPLALEQLVLPRRGGRPGPSELAGLSFPGPPAPAGPSAVRARPAAGGHPAQRQSRQGRAGPTP